MGIESEEGLLKNDGVVPKRSSGQEPFPFHPLNQREIRGQFDGGSITSDAGGLLLREVEKRTNIIGQFASCFSDYRDPELVEHGVAELLPKLFRKLICSSVKALA